MALYDIPEGDAGTKVVLKKMVELTRNGTANKNIIEFTNHIVKDLPEKNQYAEAKRLFEFVRDDIRYIKDPDKIEMVYSAYKTLEPKKNKEGKWELHGRMQGDCDDAVVVLATMWRTIGIPSRFTAIKTISNPTKYSHVYAEAKINNKWIPAETILNKPFGWSYKFPVKKLYADIDTGRLMESGGMFSGLGSPFMVIEGLGTLFSNVESIEGYEGNRLGDAKMNFFESLKNPLALIGLLVIGVSFLPKLFKGR